MSQAIITPQIQPKAEVGADLGRRIRERIESAKAEHLARRHVIRLCPSPDMSDVVMDELRALRRHLRAQRSADD
jgi:hypothetical protein